MSWIDAAVIPLAMVSILKLVAFAHHTLYGVMRRKEIAADLAHHVQKWKRAIPSEDEFRQVLERHPTLLVFERWPEFKIAKRLGISPRIVKHAFHMPKLVGLWILLGWYIITAAPEPFLVYLSATMLLLLVWSYAVQMLLMVYFLGPFDYIFRFPSSGRRTPEGARMFGPSYTKLADYMIIFVVIVALAMLSYATVFGGMSTLDREAFQQNGVPGALSFPAALHLSSLIFTTQGYGNVSTHSDLARLIVTTEIFLVFVLVVLLLFALPIVVSLNN